jgi:replication fork protection complex subunit Tof1/Swi1
MDIEAGATEVVDPQVRAFVSSLVSALGGAGDDGKYVLGDDALACLRDLKRWLKLYDEKLKRLDVARVLAESGLVNNDLVEILAGWPEDATEDRVKSKVALSCLELLVPLTWPLERGEEETKANHHRHGPYLELAQVRYKSAILNHRKHNILSQIIRVALPSMAMPLKDRSFRDESIIKLGLYVLRNIAMISAPKDLPVDEDEGGFSRSATILAFHKQKVFHLLLALSSGMGEEFDTQDVAVLEVLYHLLKGIKPEEVFMPDGEIETYKTNKLAGLIKKEQSMKLSQSKSMPTRHNRFGTMVWLKTDETRLSTVSGQSNLLSTERALESLDAAKKWKRPNRKGAFDKSINDFDIPTNLSQQAIRPLKRFASDFIDAAFNPLFTHLRRAIERQAERVQEIHVRQFFYVSSWFLSAHRLRQADQPGPSANSAGNESLSPYDLIGSVLTQETFIQLVRYLQKSFDDKQWEDLNAGARCMSQILMTVKEMTASSLEIDQEISENLQNRLFYEETVHELIAQILKSYKDQGFGYLDSITELFSVFTSMLERYSKQNADMQIRSRRRSRRKKPDPALDNDPTTVIANGGHDSEEEDMADIERTTTERNFDFNRFANRFANQTCVDTFLALASLYADLSVDQLKRAHRYFYRLGFKMDRMVILYRVDIIRLLTRMVRGDKALDRKSPLFSDWEQLAQQVIKRMTRSLQEKPGLIVEMLFSKTTATERIIQYGITEPTKEVKAVKAAAEWEVKGDWTREQKIGIVVTALIDQNKSGDIRTVKRILTSVEVERKAWEDAHTALGLEEIGTSQERIDAAPEPISEFLQRVSPTRVY